MDQIARAKIGERIKSRRNQLGVAFGELANIMGVSKMSVSLWERGETALSAENLMKLSSALQCNPVWIMTGTDNPYCNVPELSSADTDDLMIVKMLRLLPSSEKEALLEQIKNKVNYYNELYKELKAGRSSDDE